MSEFGRKSVEGANNFSFIPDLRSLKLNEGLNETSWDEYGATVDFPIELVDDELHKDYLRENPYTRFKREYTSQGIKLLPGIEDSSALEEHCFPRKEVGINRTVANAGRILRDNPQEKLADCQIILPSEHDIPQHKVALETLRGMINSSIERPPVEELPRYQFESRKIPAVNMCPEAEIHFDRSIPRGWSLMPRIDKEVEYQAIVDESDDRLDIIAVRKFEGQPSVLALEDVVVDGIVYPAGSLMRLQLKSDGPESKKHFEWTENSPPRVVSASDVLRGGFLRLSDDYIGQPEKIANYRRRVEKDLRRLGEI